MLSHTHAEIRKNVKHFFKGTLKNNGMQHSDNAKRLFLNISNTICTWVGQALDDQLCLKIEQAVSCTIFLCTYCNNNKKGKGKKILKRLVPGRWTWYSAYLVLFLDYSSKSCFRYRKKSHCEWGNLPSLKVLGPLLGTSSVTVHWPLRGKALPSQHQSWKGLGWKGPLKVIQCNPAAMSRDKTPAAEHTLTPLVRLDTFSPL